MLLLRGLQVSHVPLSGSTRCARSWPNDFGVGDLYVQLHSISVSNENKADGETRAALPSYIPSASGILSWEE
jgi:hypothetical protein